MGLILSMVVAATPTAAQTTTCTAKVTLSDDCAGKVATYTINFTAPVTLLPGNDLLSVEFPAGTGFPVLPAKWLTGDITVNGYNVTIANVLVDGLKIMFPVAGPMMITMGDTVIVVVKKITNPAGGKYELDLNYKLSCCDPVVFGCAAYTIKPAYSTYKFILDHGMNATAVAAVWQYWTDWSSGVETYPAGITNPVSYPGIAKNFATPTQAGEWNFWVVNLTYDTLGCAGYDDVQVEISLTEAPAGATATFYMYGFNGTQPLPPAWHGPTVLKEGGSILYPVPGFNITNNWGLNFTALNPVLSQASAPGTYTFCFKLFTNVPAGTCETAGSTLTLVEQCWTHVEHQWLEATCIDLFPKWNLISLPIVPFETEIAEAIKSFAFASKVLGVWQYDTLAGEYDAYPGFGLTEMVDGKGYWLKMAYGGKDPLAGTPTVPATAYGCWWVFGTDRPGDPPTPVSYDAFQGWNQIGFTSLVSAPNNVYLANWLSYFGVYGYGTIFGWGASTQQYTTTLPGVDPLAPGDGYFVNFHYDGTIYF